MNEKWYLYFKKTITVKLLTDTTVCMSVFHILSFFILVAENLDPNTGELN